MSPEEKALALEMVCNNKELYKTVIGLNGYDELTLGEYFTLKSNFDTYDKYITIQELNRLIRNADKIALEDLKLLLEYKIVYSYTDMYVDG